MSDTPGAARGLCAPSGRAGREAPVARPSVLSPLPLAFSPSPALKVRAAVRDGSLGTYTNFHTTARSEACPDIRRRRGERIRLRRTVADNGDRMGVNKRLKACGVVPIDAEGIRIRELTGAAEPTSYYAGLSTCGLVHQCPVCSSKIHAAYAVRVQAEVDACLATGGSVHHLTLTLPHSRADSLNRLLHGLDTGWARIKSGGTWTRLCKSVGYIGTERAEEHTWSMVNGHHPHLHILIFTAAPLDAAGIVALDQHIRAKWIEGVTSCGIAPPVGDIGVKLQVNIGCAGIARYVTKVQEGADWGVAQEMTRGDIKTGRDRHMTPFEVADAFFATGDLEYAAAWREYCAATKGRSAIRSSRGLRAKLGLKSAKETDQELAAAEAEGAKRTVAVIAPRVWSRVRAAGLEHDVLLASERAGFAGIAGLLARSGCGAATVPG
jgi:hypothetical protein